MSAACATPALRKGKVGDMLHAGEVVLTSSGRATTPFPAIRLESERQAGNTLRRVEQWLQENAAIEAEARRDFVNARTFRSESPGRMPPASKDHMELYLFGDVHL